MTDSVGSGTLTAVSTTAGNYAASTVFAGRTAIAHLEGSGGYWASGTTTFRPGTESFAYVEICRAGTVVGTRSIALRNASQTGWQVQRFADGLYLYVDDGAGAGASVNLFYNTAPIPSNQWCAWGCGYDVVADQAWAGVAMDNRCTIMRADTSALVWADIVAQFYHGFTTRQEREVAWCAGWLGAQANWYGDEANVLNKLYRF